MLRKWFCLLSCWRWFRMWFKRVVEQNTSNHVFGKAINECTLLPFSQHLRHPPLPHREPLWFIQLFNISKQNWFFARAHQMGTSQSSDLPSYAFLVYILKKHCRVGCGCMPSFYDLMTIRINAITLPPFAYITWPHTNLPSFVCGFSLHFCHGI